MSGETEWRSHGSHERVGERQRAARIAGAEERKGRYLTQQRFGVLRSCHEFNRSAVERRVWHRQETTNRNILAICAAGTGAYFAKPSRGISWLVTAGLLTINIPYPLLILIPNSINPIYDDAVLSEKSDGFIRAHINSRNRYHMFRTVVDCVAFGYCICTLLK